MTHAVGIDLGTTYSCVGHFKDNRVKIVGNDRGDYTTSSFVAFNDTEELVGDPAQQQAAMNPRNTVFDVKRLIGRKFNDPEVQRDCKQYSFKVINKRNNPVIQVESKGKTCEYTPVEITTMLLAKMRAVASKSLGVDVKDAVITVPAYFNNSQREDTRKAGVAAGFNVLRILNEPSAAAIAYAHEGNPTEQNILVFDLGGGTFDVSVLKQSKYGLRVLATGGDTHLGGEDFDTRLVNHFAKVFQRKHKKDISGDYRALRRLRSACERLKRSLSFQESAYIEINCLFDLEDLYEKFTRAEFENLCSDLFEKTLDSVNQVLRDSKISRDQVDEIVLVGGSTKIPKVRMLLTELFDGKTLNHSINPDHAVASGASILAAKLAGDMSESLKKLSLQDVCPVSIGRESFGDLMAIAIPRNTPIPTKHSSIATTALDNQKCVRFRIYAGERPITMKNKLLGEFTLSGLPALPAGKAKVEVTTELDADGILKMTATDQSDTTIKSTITINNVYAGHSEKSVENFLQDAKRHERDDKKEVKRRKCWVNLYRLIQSIEHAVQGLEGYTDVEELIAKKKGWHGKHKDEPLDVYVTKIKELEIKMACRLLGRWRPSDVRYPYTI